VTCGGFLEEDGEDGGCSATVALELGCTLASQSCPSYPGSTPHSPVMIKDVQLDTTSTDAAQNPDLRLLDTC
jgi:hypothetical protein